MAGLRLRLLGAEPESPPVTEPVAVDDTEPLVSPLSSISGLQLLTPDREGLDELPLLPRTRRQRDSGGGGGGGGAGAGVRPPSQPPRPGRPASGKATPVRDDSLSPDSSRDQSYLPLLRLCAPLEEDQEAPVRGTTVTSCRMLVERSVADRSGVERSIVSTAISTIVEEIVFRGNGLEIRNDKEGTLTGVNEYAVIEEISAAGRTGVVYQAVSPAEDVYAMKAVDGRFVKNARSELKILKTLRHKNIVRLHHEVFCKGYPLAFLFFEHIDGGPICAITAGGVLKGNVWTEADANLAFTQMTDGLMYIHEKGVIHRDIKPDNILWEEAKSRVVFIDFGSGFQPKGEDDSTRTTVGTPFFRPPEAHVDTGETFVARALDVWAIGVVLFILLVGRVPYGAGINGRGHAGEVLLQQKIADEELDVVSGPQELSVGVRHLLRGLLDKNVASRFTLSEVRDHSWVTGQEVMVPCETSCSDSIGSYRVLTKPDADSAEQSLPLDVTPTSPYFLATATHSTNTEPASPDMLHTPHIQPSPLPPGYPSKSHSFRRSTSFHTSDAAAGQQLCRNSNLSTNSLSLRPPATPLSLSRSMVSGTPVPPSPIRFTPGPRLPDDVPPSPGVRRVSSVLPRQGASQGDTASSGDVDEVVTVIDQEDSYKVLLVTCTFQHRRVLVSMLTELVAPQGKPVHIEACVDGGAAVEAVKRAGSVNPYSVVIMDINMTRMSGLCAAQHIRMWEASVQCRSVPIIGMRSELNEQLPALLVGAGMNNAILKPVAWPTLRLVLESVGVPVKPVEAISADRIFDDSRQFDKQYRRNTDEITSIRTCFSLNVQSSHKQSPMFNTLAVGDLTGHPGSTQPDLPHTARDVPAAPAEQDRSPAPPAAPATARARPVAGPPAVLTPAPPDTERRRPVPLARCLASSLLSKSPSPRASAAVEESGDGSPLGRRRRRAQTQVTPRHDQTASVFDVGSPLPRQRSNGDQWAEQYLSAARLNRLMVRMSSFRGPQSSSFSEDRAD
eukprot:TRINITY_DN4374_c1_g1_i1.p1 TRINITY_DN4374_c1_g1~~TRINITY_DN4374_c1_g1_i1.p1  ORF type:complete len:1010 (+),score=208.35 TRINITY_DN4374_c1_g1_i1:345-3374(+)